MTYFNYERNSGNSDHHHHRLDHPQSDRALSPGHHVQLIEPRTEVEGKRKKWHFTWLWPFYYSDYANTSGTGLANVRLTCKSKLWSIRWYRNKRRWRVYLFQRSSLIWTGTFVFLNLFSFCSIRPKFILSRASVQTKLYLNTVNTDI